jgi:hypothetical protein
MENPFKKFVIGAAVVSTLTGCDSTETKKTASTESPLPVKEVESIDTLLVSPLNEILEHAQGTEYYEDHLEQRGVKQLIHEQKDWLLSYVQSPRYRERLLLELSRQTHLPVEDASVQQSAQKIIEKRIHQIGGVKIEVHPHTEDGGYYPKVNTTRELMDNTPVVLQIKEHGVIKLGASFQNKYPNQVIHELSHASTDMKEYGDGFVDSTERSLRERVTTGIEGDFRKNIDSDIEYGYINAPTEVKARVDVLRYLLAKKNIYDATSQEFTRTHLETLLKDTEIINDVDVVTLFKMVKTGNDLVWIMNHLA